MIELTKSAIDDVPEELHDILYELGYPTSTSGYDCTSLAITYLVKDPSLIDGVTKSLYPLVAKSLGTTSIRVERNIRHGIEVLFAKGSWSNIEKYFKNTVDTDKGKVTNSEFLFTISRVLRRKLLDKTNPQEVIQ